MERIIMTEEKKLTAAQKKAAETKAAKAKAAKEAKEEAKVEEPKITKETKVEVFNNTSGYFKYVARKGMGFLEFHEAMDSDTMTVEELEQMRNSKRKVLEEGWIYVDSEEALDYLKLGKLKEKVKSPMFLQDLIQSGTPTKIVETVEKLGTSSREQFYSIMREEYKEGNFSNAHVIKEVEKILKPNTSLLDD